MHARFASSRPHYMTYRFSCLRNSCFYYDFDYSYYRSQLTENRIFHIVLSETLTSSDNFYARASESIERSKSVSQERIRLSQVIYTLTVNAPYSPVIIIFVVESHVSITTSNHCSYYYGFQLTESPNCQA